MMPDREKVIKGLRDIDGFIAERVRFEQAKNFMRTIDDALALLKEQEAVEPKQVELYWKDDWYGLVCVCPDCKAEWMSDKDDTHFCPKCGKAVLWE